MSNDGSPSWQYDPVHMRYTSEGPPQFEPQSSQHHPAQPTLRKCAKWDLPEHNLFIESCDTVINEGHRRGKCFSATGWKRIAELFNRKSKKGWTVAQMKSYWFKLRTSHKHLFELLRCTGISYHSTTGRILAPEHWWESKIKENPKYAKYKDFDCSAIYDTYGKLFGDTGDSTKYTLSPSKLSQRGFDLGTDSGGDDGGDKFPINAEGTDSSGSPDRGKSKSSMNISDNRSGEKRGRLHCTRSRNRKKYGAREISASLDHMVSVGTDLASSLRSHSKGGMSVAECVEELLSSGHMEEGGELHMFALWFLGEKQKRDSYCAAKTPYLRFKFVEYCFQRDNKGSKNV